MTREIVRLNGWRPVEAAIMSPEALAEQLERLLDIDLCAASQQARRFIDEHHCWRAATPVFWQAFHEAIGPSARASPLSTGDETVLGNAPRLL